jgi:quercetin dioxygenase-like cupin family protein
MRGYWRLSNRFGREAAGIAERKVRFFAPLNERFNRSAGNFFVKIAAHMNGQVTRELLQTAPVVDLPGWETRLFLITYAPGADASNHSHPVVGVGLVVEGTMVSAFDDDSEEIVTAGQSFMDRASVHRVSRNGSQTEPLKFVIAYTVRKGEPNTIWPGEAPAFVERERLSG